MVAKAEAGAVGIHGAEGEAGPALIFKISSEINTLAHSQVNAAAQAEGGIASVRVTVWKIEGCHPNQELSVGRDAPPLVAITYADGISCGVFLVDLAELEPAHFGLDPERAKGINVGKGCVSKEMARSVAQIVGGNHAADADVQLSRVSRWKYLC